MTLLTAALLAGCTTTSNNVDASGSRDASNGKRPLLFADEFDAPLLDRSKWTVIGPDFSVNDEQQAYVDSPETITFTRSIAGADGGVLALKALFDHDYEDPRIDRQADFLSGRIESEDKFDFTYGRAEARIKMTDSIGAWPAFWLLGDGKWPDTGEIDIMEYVGEKSWIGVALHGPGYAGDTPLVKQYFFPAGEDATGWHIYAVEWSEEELRFEIDGELIYRVTRSMVEHYGDWRFDTPKHIILNMALGGTLPFVSNGVEEPYRGLPQTTVEQVSRGEVAMYIDWVRVYAPE